MDALQIRLLANQRRADALTMIHLANTGHTGGAMSVLDILSVLYYDVLRVRPEEPGWPERDRFLLSKGHSVEGYLALLADRGFFPKEELKTFSQPGSRLIGHPSVKVPGVEVCTGALGHGLPIGVGIALAAKRSKAFYNTYVAMGDGEQAEGSVWEAAMAGAHYQLDNLFAIIDRNGLQISGTTEQVMGLEDFAAKWRAFGWEVTDIDGHDVDALLHYFHTAKQEGKPHCLIAHTVKAKGLPFAENKPEWHHKVPTKEQLAAAYEALGVKGGGMGMSTQAVRMAFTQALLKLAKDDKDIFAVATDSRGSVTLGDFAKELPEQFVECGIAEQDAIGISAGLANGGKKPFVCGPACFYSLRSAEQVKVDVAYSHTNVKIIGVSGGVSYGALGSTHHAIQDVALLRAVPGIQIFLPADGNQMVALTKYLADSHEPAYVRMGRGPVPDIYEENPVFTPGKTNVLREGEDGAIIACGEMVYHALEAAKLLANEGISVRVLDMHTLKPLDEAAVLDAAKTGAVLTVEEHHIYGGLGAAVAQVLCEKSPTRMRILGLPDENLYTGASADVFAHYGLTREGIARAMKELLGR